MPEISLSRTEIKAHPVFYFEFVKFKLDQAQYDQLASMIRSYSLDEKELNPFASKLFELMHRKVKKRERRVESAKFDPREFRTLFKLLEILRTQGIEKLTFTLKKRSGSITVTEAEFLSVVRELILNNHDPLILQDIKEQGSGTEIVKNKSKLISEELEEFLPSAWVKSTRIKFITDFYKLAGVTLSRDALKQRGKSSLI